MKQLKIIILNERVELWKKLPNDMKFIRGIAHKFGYPLDEMEKYAYENYIPIAKPEVADFFKFLL